MEALPAGRSDAGSRTEAIRWRDVYDLALESLKLHRLRTGLTLLAIAIGVTAVLLLTALGDAAKAYVVREFAGIGTNLVIALPGKVETSGMPAAGGTQRDLTLDDAEAIRHRAPAVAQLAPLALGSAPFVYGGRTRSVYVAGTTATYQQIRNVTMAAGRFLPPGDPRQGENVVVIGRTIQREVFRDENPLGKSVRLAEWRMRVIGIMAPKGQSMGMDFDDLAIVPVATCLKMFNHSGLFRVMAQAADAAAVPVVQQQMRRILTDRHEGKEDFTLITQDAMLATFRSIIDVLTAALAGIAAISLAVAGIGIMNVMLVSVSERTSEVGLLKALGATRGQIIAVFMVEALLLSTFGAALGILLGITGIAVGAGIWPEFPLQPSLVWIAVVLSLSLVFGASFGLMPARRAARLQPAEALRGKR
jgi:putative ABC transport system permease protein